MKQRLLAVYLNDDFFMLQKRSRFASKLMYEKKSLFFNLLHFYGTFCFTLPSREIHVCVNRYLVKPCPFLQRKIAGSLIKADHLVCTKPFSMIGKYNNGLAGD